MVRAKADRPHRRPKGAGPQRDGGEEDGSVPALVVDKHPNITAQREMDRLEHVRRARAMGATRKQASRHADEEVGGH